ncbi:unnamed protein product [Adineta steineri]|uniref:Uncharacterized protein n=1 Tax=Adineta steineri TaxID=433720 RepID=A0A816CW08_9BILA|nr:unnamed protein product [Adineta steineri]CAF1629361.1 unnamed protein product [Adineta steineri]
MDLTKHRQLLNEELHHIINDYNQFKQRFSEQKPNSHDLSLINQINQWEIDSIIKIQQKARDCRETVIKCSQTFLNDIEKKFNDLNEQLKQIHNENEFNEINLNYLRNELIKITEELNNPPKTSIIQDFQLFINDVPIIPLDKKPKWDKWKQNAITVASENGPGQKLNQFNCPYGIFIDEKKNIFIADYLNHRIVEWKCNAKEGKVVAGGNKEGNRIDQLNRPTDVIVDQQTHSIIIADQGNRRVIQWLNQKQQILIHNIDCFGLAMDKHGFLYVSNYKKNEVRRWKISEYNNEGTVVAGGNGKGNQLNQLNSPGFIFVDEVQSVYVAGRDNYRVMKWRKDAKEGTIVAGGNLNQLFYPRGITVDDLGQIYVADFCNHRIMRWCEGKEEGEILVGGNGQGNQSNQLNGPYGLSFDDEGNLYVADSFNHRIQKFEIILLERIIFDCVDKDIETVEKHDCHDTRQAYQDIMINLQQILSHFRLSLILEISTEIKDPDQSKKSFKQLLLDRTNMYQEIVKCNNIFDTAATESYINLIKTRLGCQSKCPGCGTKCDNPEINHTKHSSRHLGGAFYERTPEWFDDLEQKSKTGDLYNDSKLPPEQRRAWMAVRHTLTERYSTKWMEGLEKYDENCDHAIESVSADFEPEWNYSQS